jgi:hypothetical protein
MHMRAGGQDALGGAPCLGIATATLVCVQFGGSSAPATEIMFLAS